LKILPDYLKARTGMVLTWLIIGYIIRVTLIPFAWHVDIITDGYIAWILRKNGQYVIANNPPLYYFFLALVHTVLDPVFPGGVFSDVPLRIGFTPTSLTTAYRTAQPSVWIYLFTQVMIAIPFDFGVALLLFHFVKDPGDAVLAFKLWMISPISIFTVVSVGGRHTIPTFLLFFSLYSFSARRSRLGAVLLGLASALNWFFLLSVPIVIALYWKGRDHNSSDHTNAFLLLLIMLSPFIIADLIAPRLIPAYYESLNAATARDFEFSGFFGRTLYYRGQPGNPLASGPFFFFLDYSIGLQTLSGFSDTIYISVIVYGLLFLWTIHARADISEAWKFILTYFLLYYSFSLFHPQWFIWMQPFLVSWMIGKRDRVILMLYALLVVSYFVYWGYWNPSVTAALESIHLPAVQVINLSRSLMSAAMIFLAYHMFRDISNRAENR